MLHRRFIALIGTLTVAALVAAPVVADAAPAKKAPRVLTILVTNDDGVTADGIDALVEGLRKQPKVQVTVIAPLTNKSGTGDRTSPTPPPVSDAKTKSGYNSVAVDGFPSDSVNYALVTLGVKPDLVVSGINQGQNIGPAVALSATVGAAKTAVRRGIPALAVSQGLGNPPDYASGVAQTIKWFKQHRKALTRAHGTGATTVANLNVPTCLTGKVRGLDAGVSVATSGDFLLNADKVNCASTVKKPSDDVTAFNNGFATLSDAPAG